MPLSLAATQHVAQLADVLYSFLPGSTPWAGTYTFAQAAHEAGVTAYWSGGSKRPAINRLLAQTLELQPERFCPLILRIVQEGLFYRSKRGEPITRNDVRQLNEILLRLKFKIPELWDDAFLSSLLTPTDGQPAPSAPDDQQPSDKRHSRAVDLADLAAEFLGLDREADRPKAGLALESLLNRLFRLFGMNPRQPFRVVGEQIDGSFDLDGHVYLLEAKWTKDKIAESHLLVFKGKIEGKSPFTRGLFISVNGYSQESVFAITKGKNVGFVMLDGAHLYRALSADVDFAELIRSSVRRLAETGDPYVPISHLTEN